MKVIDWFDTGIFPATVLFSCGFEYDEIISLLKKKKANEWLLGINEDKKLIDGGNYFGLYREIVHDKFGSKHLFYIIVREQFKFSDDEYCKLAHEILHICQFMLPPILDRNKEHEAEAYLHTYLMRKCLKALR